MPGYLGNKSDMTVHHLAAMKVKCGIYYIKKEFRVYFTPDTLEQAKKENFVPCILCNDIET